MIGKGNVLDPLDAHLQVNLIHIGGNQAGIHRLTRPIAQGILAVPADGFPLVGKVNINHRLFNLVGNGLGAHNLHRGIFQLPVVPVGDKAIRHRANPLHFHRDGLRNPALHIEENAPGAFGLHHKGVAGHISREGNGIAHGNLIAGLVNIGQIRLDCNIGGIDFHKVGTVAGQLQVDGGSGLISNHQSPLSQHRFIAQH